MPTEAELEGILDADAAKDVKAQSTPPSKAQAAELTKPPAARSLVGESAFFEGEVLAYRELIQVAKAIASIIRDDGRFQKLTLLDERDVGLLPALEAFLIQVRMIRDQYREISSRVTKAALEAVTVAGVSSAVKGFVDLLSLFGSDVEVSGREFAPDQVALIAELANALQGAASVTYFCGWAWAEEKPGKIAEALQEVAQAKKEALRAAGGNVALEARIAAINSLFDSLLRQLLNAAPSEASLLATLARADALHESLRDGYILVIKIIRAGVGRRVIENLWTRLFYSDRIAHSGGVVVTFMILDQKGTIRLSRTLYSHSGYTKFRAAALPFEEGRNF